MKIWVDSRGILQARDTEYKIQEGRNVRGQERNLAKKKHTGGIH